MFRAKEALRQCLPDQLKDSTFQNVLKDDTSTKRWLQQLFKNLETSPNTNNQQQQSLMIQTQQPRNL